MRDIKSFQDQLLGYIEQIDNVIRTLTTFVDGLV